MKTIKTLFLASACALFGLCVSCNMDSYFVNYDGMYPMETSPDGTVNPQEPVNGDRFDAIIDNEFVATATEPVSTFSVDADGAFYSYLRRIIQGGLPVVKSFVRIEEMLNYFPFDYADPADGENVALNAELGDCPWSPGHKLLRLGLKGKSLAESEIPTANFVFLIDVSGSMEGEDRLTLLKNSLLSMLKTMRGTDRISIVTYSGTVKKVLSSTPVSEAAKIEAAIKKLSASGSTAGGEAMKMAYEEALKNYIKGGNNRVIMGTDGDFNVGVTSTDALTEMVQDYASKGIYLTVCGFGSGNLNDSMMETLSNKGNGTYEYISCNDDMEKVFVRERSKFFSVANDCKIQISFNPESVEKYRLIGYENRILSNDDFENDDKDAAEIVAGQSITALYELVPATAYASGKVASFDFRYKKTLGSESRLVSLDIFEEQKEPSESFCFASAVASFGMILRDSEYKGSSNFSLVHELAASGSKSFDPYGYRKTFDELVSTYENRKK